jgi:NAD(P)-dependent dehydrogenase (short-subunit alcohol dehydrogenase family)
MMGEGGMSNLRDKVVAVTGAGSGIGRALALDLVSRGAHVALADIHEAHLRETVAMLGSSRRVSVHVVDVSDRQAVERYAAEAKAQHGGVDAIINNAGVVAHNTIEAMSYEDFAFVIDVNLWGVVYGTKAFLPLLRERGGGHIVNISSINGMVPFVKNGPYNVSKYAVLGFNETLMQELRGSPIHITSVHPGGIRTNIARNARGAVPELTDSFDKVATTSAKQAAKVILDGVERKRQRVYVGWDAKLMALGKRLAPGLTVWLSGVISQHIQK